MYLYCLVPRRLSLDENLGAKDSGEEKTGETCASRLALRNQSLAFCARLYAKPCMRKTKRLKEEAGTYRFYSRFVTKLSSTYRI